MENAQVKDHSTRPSTSVLCRLSGHLFIGTDQTLTVTGSDTVFEATVWLH